MKKFYQCDYCDFAAGKSEVEEHKKDRMFGPENYEIYKLMHKEMDAIYIKAHTPGSVHRFDKKLNNYICTMRFMLLDSNILLQLQDNGSYLIY